MVWEIWTEQIPVLRRQLAAILDEFLDGDDELDR